MLGRPATKFAERLEWLVTVISSPASHQDPKCKLRFLQLDMKVALHIKAEEATQVHPL